MDVSKIFSKARAGALPRVEIPNLSDEERDRIQEVRAEADRFVGQRRGYFLAMLSSGRTPFDPSTVGSVERARRRAKGKRQRAARRIHRRAAS